MWASTPRSSCWRTTTLVCSPVMSTSMPSMRRMTAAPPPMLTPRTSSVSPPSSRISMSTVLGCSTSSAPFARPPTPPSSVARTNRTPRPASCARSNESRMPRSSAESPSMPATRALSVPCPVPVCANEPCSVNVTCLGRVPHSRRAMRAMASAPAVCELEGPTMIGPMMSRSPNVFTVVLSADAFAAVCIFAPAAFLPAAVILACAPALQVQSGRNGKIAATGTHSRPGLPLPKMSSACEPRLTCGRL